MNELEASFLEMRKVSTPWCVVRTTDYMATIKRLLSINMNKEGKTKACLWTCVDGIQTPVRSPSQEAWSEECGDAFATSDDPPFVMLKNALWTMGSDSILFLVAPDNTVFDNTFTIQAISNLREPFKMTGRMLVILGTNPKLPDFLAEDVPILDDPLPDVKELKACVEALAKDAKATISEPTKAKAAEACLGMTRFAAEEAVARKLRKSGVDLAGLNVARQKVIEDASNRALVFEKEKWTFDDVGGLEAFKSFVTDIFNGPRSPTVIVRVDEIDKSITAASTGAVADNTGVSQDILKCLLTALEDNQWMGLLAVGGPGTGKTLASICTGNQFQTRTLSLDLGAVKGSLVGESEGKIRRVVDILRSVGGKNVLFMATCNRLDTLPPELQRRFWLGTWFWDLPNEEERSLIWKIQRARFQISPKDAEPAEDGDWTGSDIRNCCQMAWVTGTSLEKAGERITIAGKTSKDQIESLRRLAARSGFRSANYGGPYKLPEAKAVPARKIMGRDQ